MKKRKHFSAAVALALAFAVGLTVTNASDLNTETKSDGARYDDVGQNRVHYPANGDVGAYDETAAYEDAIFAYGFSAEPRPLETHADANRKRQLQSLMKTGPAKRSNVDDLAFETFHASVPLAASPTHTELEQPSLIDHDLDISVDLVRDVELQLASHLPFDTP